LLPCLGDFFFLPAEENPGASVAELSKLLGAAYKELSEEEKAVYVAKAADDKERMEREIAEGGVVPARKTKAVAAKAATAGAGQKTKPAAKRLNNAPYDVSSCFVFLYYSN
jgi:HMG (high mobility group) box